MLKKLILSATLLLGILAPAAASASYVCSSEYFGGTPRVKLVLTTSPSCAGTTTTYWICDPSLSSTGCGLLRYSKDEILSLQSSLVSAAHTQQIVFASTTTCQGGASGCLYSLQFRQ